MASRERAMTRASMKLLAIDPGSVNTGYALFEDDKLVDAGRLHASQTWTPVERIHALIADMRKLIADTGPGTIVIEITSGKVQARHGGGGAGLAIYGVAVGALWATCLQHAAQVEAVLENVWTCGVPKRSRQMAVAAAYPQYRASQLVDRGGDIADAIGLGLWYMQRTRLRGGTQR